MSRYYQPEIETASRETIEKLQTERLIKQVKHVYENVEYYRKKMDERGVKPEDIKELSDLRRLPFVTKDDLREAYPYGFLGCPLSKCVRIQSTSGTTGKRVVAFYTEHDRELWFDCCARALVAAGATKEDITQVAYGYGLFTGAAGVEGGASKVGCMTLPMSSGSSERQIQFMTDLGSTILCCTPSYAAYLAELIKKENAQDRLKLRIGIFGAEAWTEEMRQDIQESLGIKAYDIYGLTEISGPGVAYECEEQRGMHVNEDHFIVELINPKTGEYVKDGEKGEVVFTCIDKEAFPLLRYRTKDIAVLSHEPCSCGRTFVKMTKPMGRSDDMLIIKGVNVFPSQIEGVLLQNGYPANYQLIVTREHNNDALEVRVELPDEKFSDDIKSITRQEKALVAALKAVLGIKAQVKLLAPRSIERSEGKAKRIIDKRNLY